MENHTRRTGSENAAGSPPAQPTPGESEPGTESPETLQPTFDLIHGAQTPSAPRQPPPPRRPTSPPAPAPETPTPETPASEQNAPGPPAISTASLDPLIEHLAREISAMVSAAKEQIRQAAAMAATNAVAKVSAHLDARARAIEAHVAEVTRHVAELIQKMDELLRASVAVAENNDSLLAEVQQVTVTKLENVIKRTEDQVGEVLKRGEAQSKSIGATAQALVDEAKRCGRRLAWKPWAMATAFALTTIIMITLLRPGWTMSGEQRRALRVGEAVIYTYSSAPESERKEMRRVMRWRTPENPDSVEAPPVPSRP